MTVPVGVVDPDACFTLAVSVTEAFWTIEELDAVNVVLVLTTAEFTVTSIVLEEDGLKVLLPPYDAVMELTPSGRVVVVSVAVPEESVAVPIGTAPL